MASQDVIIRYSGDPSQLAAASKKAQSAVDGVTGAVSKTAEAQKKVAQSSSALESKFDKVGQVSSKLAGGMNLVSKGSGDLLRDLNDLADMGVVASESLAAVGISGGVAAAVIAALAIEIGFVVGVYKQWNAEATMAAQIAEDVKAAEEARQPILDALKQSTIDLALATGQLSEAEAFAATEAEKAAKRQQDALEPIRTKVQGLIDQQDDLGTAFGDTAEYFMPSWTPLGYAIDGLTVSTSELRQEIAANLVEVQKTIEANERLTETDIAAAEAKRQEKEALEDIAAGEREAEKAKQRAERAAQARAQAAKEAAAANLRDAETVYTMIEALREMEEQSKQEAKGKLSDSEVITQAYHQEIEAIEEKRIAATAAAHDYYTLNAINTASDAAAAASAQEYAAKQVALYQEAQAAKVAATEEAAVRIAELEEKQTAIFEKGKEDRIALAIAERDARLQVAGDLLGQLGDIADEVAARQMDALSETTESLDAVRGLLSDLSDDTVDASALYGDALVNAYKEGEVSAEELSEAQKLFLQQTLEAEEAALESKQKAEKESALKTWQIQKQLAAANAIVLAIEASLRGLATGGPVLAAVYAALGLAQVAMIETAKPPSFRSGYFGDSGGADSSVMPDQRLAWIEPDSEVVMPSQGVQAAGGLDAARAQAAGIPPSVENTTVVRFGHREISRIVSSPSARKGILDASVRPRGRGNPYKKVQ